MFPSALFSSVWNRLHNSATTADLPVAISTAWLGTLINDSCGYSERADWKVPKSTGPDHGSRCNGW